MQLALTQLVQAKRVVLVGGKGGVGKTSVSSAIATHAAQLGRRVLLVSTDPAHSLSDVFDQKIGGKPRRLAANLDVLELNPDDEVDAYLDRVLAQMRRYAGPDQVAELQRHLRLSRQSPGAQEAALLERICQLITDGVDSYDLLVFDTAPTGHTLRLLSLPEMMAAWTSGLLRHNERSEKFGEVLKHLTPKRDVPSVFSDPLNDQNEELPDKQKELLSTLQNRQRLFHQTLRRLSDHQQSGFLFVLTPERLPIQETERAILALSEVEVEVSGVIVNRVIPQQEQVGFWQERYLRQQELMTLIDKKFDAFPLLKVGLQPQDIVGMAALQGFADKLFIN